MEHKMHPVELRQERVVLPAYNCGELDRNPMSPDVSFDEREKRSYTAVFLENDYLRAMVVPELGGRIQRLLDKTDGCEFDRCDELVRPVLMGLAEPWIGGGSEIDGPQRHGSTTPSPVDYALFENADGSKALRMSAVDPTSGIRGEVCFTLRPDRACIEIKGRLYNRTGLPQAFPWWVNPAAAGSDRARSDCDFVRGCDRAREAGLLYVADHSILPDRRQSARDSGDSGRAPNRNLADNPPDFTWLKPFEERTFTQYFLPYRQLADVKNASRELLLNLEVEGGVAKMRAYATARYENAVVYLLRNGRPIFLRCVTLSPAEVFRESVPTDAPEAELALRVTDAGGWVLLDCAPRPARIERAPEPGAPAKRPEEIATNEELYLSGLHIEQYRRVARLPDPYYLEGLKRDPGDIRINNAYGTLLMRRGQFAESERYFRAAIARMTRYNPNPSDGEAYCNLGLSLFYQGRDDEAFDAFSKAGRTGARQEMSFYYLAALAARRSDWPEALEHIERSLVSNGRNRKARALKARILSMLWRDEEALACARENLRLDPFDYASRMLLAVYEEEGAELRPEERLAETLRRMGNRADSFIECAIDLAEAGLYGDAVDVLRRCEDESPMRKYYEALYIARDGGRPVVELREAAELSPIDRLSGRLEDIAALQFAIKENPDDARAPYYLGCLWCDKRRYESAIEMWERSAKLDPAFPAVRRRLAQAYFHRRGDRARALECMERAYALDEGDARALLELDRLRHRLNVPPAERLAFLDARRDVVFRRDDLSVEYVTLLNLLGRYEDAVDIMLERRFHPGEGIEGRIAEQYALAATQMAIRALDGGDAAEARFLLKRALSPPENLGEGKSASAEDSGARYYLGVTERTLGNDDAAQAEFTRAAQVDAEPADMMRDGDPPVDRLLYRGLASRALGDEPRARACFRKLIACGEEHCHDEAKIDDLAASPPDLPLFGEDLTLRNRAHCAYLIALGSSGLGDRERAKAAYDAALAIDPAHLGATIHRRRLTGE